MYSKKLPQVRPIARGGACNNCKRRKMRCDGQRPVCGPCSRRIESLGDCEYAEVGHTHADRLQEQIAVLEARLEALQNPFSQRDAVTLIDPYVASSSVMSQLHRTSSDSGPAVMVNGSRNPFEESAQAGERNLMEAFLPHASQLGFFLDAQNLIYAFSNPYSDPSQRPTAALAATMVLLGSKLVPASHIILPTEVYLSNAVQAVSLGLSESHPQRILHTLQANILIAHYFLIHNRGLEGRWHLNNAVSLILSARMHRIRSSHIYDNTQALSIDTTTTLPPARNFPEEGERINAIWTVLALDCLWSAVEGKPTFTAYTTGQGRVDTPWPLESYSDASLSQNMRDSHTLQKFLSNIADDGRSVLALYVKATVLFEQATLFWKRYSYPENRTPAELIGFQSSFESLRSLLSRLLSELPPIEDEVLVERRKRLLIVHTLTRKAMIRLYCTFGAKNPSCRPIFLEMVDGILRCLNYVEPSSMSFLDPIMAVLCKGTALVCVEAIQLFRSSSNSSAAEIQKYVGYLNKILEIMNCYSHGNPLMATKMTEIRAQYASLADH